MRAIVLICLLHAALPFSWDPSRLFPTLGPGSECVTDSGSCGCCMVSKEMDRLTTYFTTTLTTLEKEYGETKYSLDKMKGSRSAFSAALTDDTNICNVLFKFNKLLTYKRVFINLGNGYSADTGVFTVPYPGVYSLALTVYSAPGRKMPACANLLVNDQSVAGPREGNNLDQEDSATTVLALRLKAGDTVAVELPSRCYICDDSSQYNTFSAFFLYATE